MQIKEENHFLTEIVLRRLAQVAKQLKYMITTTYTTGFQTVCHKVCHGGFSNFTKYPGISFILIPCSRLQQCNNFA